MKVNKRWGWVALTLLLLLVLVLAGAPLLPAALMLAIMHGAFLLCARLLTGARALLNKREASRTASSSYPWPGEPLAPVRRLPGETIPPQNTLPDDANIKLLLARTETTCLQVLELFRTLETITDRVQVIEHWRTDEMLPWQAEYEHIAGVMDREVRNVAASSTVLKDIRPLRDNVGELQQLVSRLSKRIEALEGRGSDGRMARSGELATSRNALPERSTESRPGVLADTESRSGVDASQTMTIDMRALQDAARDTQESQSNTSSPHPASTEAVRAETAPRASEFVLHSGWDVPLREVHWTPSGEIHESLPQVLATLQEKLDAWARSKYTDADAHVYQIRVRSETPPRVELLDRSLASAELSPLEIKQLVVAARIHDHDLALLFLPAGYFHRGMFPGGYRLLVEPELKAGASVMWTQPAILERDGEETYFIRQRLQGRSR